MTWDAARCIHAAECVHGLPEAFDPAAKPWIRPEEADAASLADVVNRCPSGALRMQYPDGTSAMTAPPLNTCHVTRDGPNYLRGNLTLVAGRTRRVEDTRIALCRCGAVAEQAVLRQQPSQDRLRTMRARCRPRCRRRPAPTSPRR